MLSTQSTRTRRKLKLGHDPIQSVPVVSISPSPENDKLYRPVDMSTPEMKALTASIHEHGIQEPLILTRDYYIISGHRRFAAAKRLMMDTVPCRIRQDLSRAENPDLFLRMLRECNRQRNKTASERVREEVVSANPADTYNALCEHRKRKSDMTQLEPMELGETKERARITSAKVPFMEAIIRVLNERRKYWPLSDRQIHYALLNNPPLIHARKPQSVYRNDKASYKALTELLTRMRIVGHIPHPCIADETRPMTTWAVHQDVQDYIREEMENLLQGYWRDPLQSQPNQVELLVEKNTVSSILRSVAEEYGLPMTSGRGYCSLPPRYQIAKRFEKSGKERLILLIVSDFDPDGETIASSFARSMRDDFGIENVDAVKVALTWEQVQQFNLPPGMKAKEGCSTRSRFVEQYGDDVYELEAIPPADLQRITRDAIDSVLDLDLFNRERDAEQEESVTLDGVRRRMLDAAKDQD